jgi:6-phosphogluconolactonase
MKDAPSHILKTQFETAAALAVGVARSVAASINAAIAVRGRATVALSGGSTPKAAYALLAREDVDWEKVTVTLCDDRWVPSEDPRSNERLLRETLFAGGAAPRFLPLYTGDADPHDGAGKAEATLAGLWPFDLALLGMGEDGHTASLIPGGDTLMEGLDPATPHRLLGLTAESVPEPRITMTLPALLDCRRILVVFAGEAKREVYREALSGGPVEAMPIRGVLNQQDVPVDVFYC